MAKQKYWIALLGAALSLSIAGSSAAVYGADLVNSLVSSGESADLTNLGSSSGGANVNRLGGFISDLFYDRLNNLYYGLADRGPGGGTIAYSTRVQKFTLTVNPTTGAISNFQLIATIPFVIPAGTTLNGVTYTVDTPFNGLDPQRLNGNPAVLGASQDPEGFVVAPNGHFFVSDEYGPSVYEFAPDGRFVRALAFPGNLIPRTNAAGNPVDYVATRSTSPALVLGRQDNRGFEGVTISPDGTKLYALLQDPLVNEGDSSDGRRSQNLRLVVFDIASGQSIVQYIYQLESISTINLRVPSNPFSATNQGRSIGISSLSAITDQDLLVIERDNRGTGVDDPLGATPVSTKRVYRINLAGATDVSNLSLAGTSTLPAGVVPVSKSLFLDIQTALQGAGLIVPEKIEGLAVGPRLSDGTYALLLGTDNDFSVTQNSSNTQFDVCTNLTPTTKATTSTQVALDAGCPTGQALIPTFTYSFKTTVADNLQLPPVIAGFTPTSGPAGTVVTVNGSGFLNASSVRFYNNKSATFTVVSDNQLTATVPVGATTGKFQVSTPVGRAISSSRFTVTSP